MYDNALAVRCLILVASQGFTTARYGVREKFTSVRVAQTWSVRLHSCIVQNDESTAALSKNALVMAPWRIFFRNLVCCFYSCTLVNQIPEEMVGGIGRCFAKPTFYVVALSPTRLSSKLTGAVALAN